MENLFSHQISAIKSAFEKKYVLIIRPLGSGKTLIALQIIESYLKSSMGPAVYIGPAHLINQYLKEHNKWGLSFHIQRITSPIPNNFSERDCYCISYDLIRRHKTKILSHNWPLVIIDEFQHGKNSNTKNFAVFNILRKKANYFIGMTGAPFQNGPHEFFTLISTIAGKDLRWDCENCLEYKFKKKYSKIKLFFIQLFKIRINRGPVIGIKNPDKLKNIIKQYIDYVDPNQCYKEAKIPEIKEEYIFIELSSDEVEYYKKILRKFRKKKDKEFLSDNLDDVSIDSEYFRLSELRQSLLCYNEEFPSSKVKKICDDTQEILKNSKNRILIFSNFVKKGSEIISKALLDRGINHDLFTGNVSQEKRKEIIEKYMNGTIRTIVLSPVGHEGLDLIGTTHVFIADPHYNPERTEQMIARATRAYSGENTVVVRHYIAKHETIKDRTIDESILKIAQRKANINNLIKNLIKNID